METMQADRGEDISRQSRRIYQSMLYASAVDATPKTKKDERL